MWCWWCHQIYFDDIKWDWLKDSRYTGLLPFLLQLVITFSSLFSNPSMAFTYSLKPTALLDLSCHICATQIFFTPPRTARALSSETAKAPTCSDNFFLLKASFRPISSLHEKKVVLSIASVRCPGVKSENVRNTPAGQTSSEERETKCKFQIEHPSLDLEQSVFQLEILSADWPAKYFQRSLLLFKFPASAFFINFQTLLGVLQCCA